MTQETDFYKAINWNAIEDVVDKATWEKLTEQFWLDTRIPLSNDLDDWRKLSEKERDLVGKVFGGLTLLDTLQSVDGVSAIKSDVRTQHEEAVLNNIEFMECYTKDHKLLTIDRGWVPIADIVVGDIVLAYDPKTETTRFEKVLETSKHKAPYIERIYNSGIDLRVSPGHRMLFEETSLKSGSPLDAWKSYKYGVVTAEDFVKLPKTAYRRVPLVRPFVTQTSVSLLTPFEKLLIAFQADGSITEREIKRIQQYRDNDPRLKTETFTLRFSFSKEPKIAKLLKLCEDSGISYKEINGKLGSGKCKPQRNFNVFVPFTMLGSLNLKPKVLNNWFSFSDFNAEKAQQFIEELSLWDSHVHYNEDGSRGYISYYTKEIENANFVKVLSTLAGYTHNSGVNIDDRSEKYSDNYYVRILSSKNQRDVQLQSLSFEKLEGEEVYGVEVPSQFLVVSAGQKTIISGNCVHAKSYSSIFSTLNTKAEIEEIFEWTANNPYLQRKAEIIKEVYDNGTPLQKKVASVFLESFLFYSGFFTPLWYLGNNKLPNVAEIIKLIIRDECMTKDQRVLTPNGWVSVADIRPQDLVLQFDKETRRTNFAPVSTISTDFAPKLYNFKSQLGYVDLTCSPKHRIIRKAITSDGLVTRTAETNFGQTSSWLHSTPLLTDNKGATSLTDWEKFYLLMSRYGTLTQQAQQIDLVVSSSKLDKIERFKALFDRLSLDYVAYNYKYGNGNMIRISDVPNQGIDLNKLKLLPKRNLNEVTLEWCQDYLNTLFEWVGSAECETSINYYSTHKDYIDYVQSLCTLVGYKTRFSVVKDSDPYTVEGIKNYCLHVIKNCSLTAGTSVVRTEVEGAQVYGIQVPSGYLVTRGKGGSVVITGNSVHGTYIGYKFQLAFNELPEEEQEELKEWIYDLLYTLYENEEKYTEELYDEIGWTEEVKTFLRYNANKALMNLGQNPLFPESAEDVNPIIMNGISTGTSNHDFFSQVGNGYLLGQVEAMTDEDYTVGL